MARLAKFYDNLKHKGERHFLPCSRIFNNSTNSEILNAAFFHS